MSDNAGTISYETLSTKIYKLELEEMKIGLAITELLNMLSEPGVFQEIFTYLKTIRQLAFINFSHEEGLMITYAENHLKSHSKDHKQLLDHIDGLIAMLELANRIDEVNVVSVNEFITKWYAKHTMCFDGPLIDALKKL